MYHYVVHLLFVKLLPKVYIHQLTFGSQLSTCGAHYLFPLAFPPPSDVHTFNQWQIEIGQRTKKKVEWDGYLLLFFFLNSQGFQLN